MRRISGLTGLAFLCVAALCNAQTKCTTLFTPSESPTLTITNTYTEPITAYILTVNVKPDGEHSTTHLFVRDFYDSYVNRIANPPILPGKSRMILVPHRIGVSPAELALTVRAVVFADGTTEGDAHWIGEALKMRRGCYREVLSVESLLLRARTTRMNIDDLRAELRKLTVRNPGDHSFAALVTGIVADNALGNLEDSINPSLDATQKLTLTVDMVKDWRRSLETARPSPSN